MSEIASFRADDDGCYVAPDRACPWCLSWAVEWRLRRLGWDAAAVCRCTSCERERDVYLSPEQALRLALHDRCPLDLNPHPSLLHLVS